MGGHAPLTRFTHTEAFLGLGKDHDGTTLLMGSGVISGIDFFQIVATALQAINLFIG